MPGLAQTGLSVALAAMLACGEPWAPDTRLKGISGTWAADITGNILVSITVQDVEGMITGTGFIAVLTIPGSTSLTVSGVRADADLTLHLADPVGGSITFVGKARGDGLVGVLNGLQFASMPATFVDR